MIDLTHLQPKLGGTNKRKQALIRHRGRGRKISIGKFSTGIIMITATLQLITSPIIWFCLTTKRMLLITFSLGSATHVGREMRTSARISFLRIILETYRAPLTRYRQVSFRCWMFSGTTTTIKLRYLEESNWKQRSSLD